MSFKTPFDLFCEALGATAERDRFPQPDREDCLKAYEAALLALLAASPASRHGLHYLPAPATRVPFLTEALRLRTRFETDAYRGSVGELRWLSNGRCVPLDCLRDAFVEAPAAQALEIATETRSFLEQYRREHAGKPPTAEERAEARAAHGPGVKLVNAITGDSFIT